MHVCWKLWNLQEQFMWGARHVLLIYTDIKAVTTARKGIQ